MTALRLDGLDDLRREAVAVFQTSAILVGTLVDIFQGELVEKIALVHRVNLHAVHPGLFQQSGALGEGIDDLLNLRFRHFPGGQFIRPAVFRRAGGGGDLV